MPDQGDHWLLSVQSVRPDVLIITVYNNSTLCDVLWSPMHGVHVLFARVVCITIKVGMALAHNDAVRAAFGILL